MSARPDLATLVPAMERWGTQHAIVEHRGVRTRRTGYAGLARGAWAFAAELDRRGIRPGERVLLWGENSAAWVACFFGCVLRGVLVVPLDATGSLAFAERVLRETSPRLLAGDPALLRQLASGTAQFQLDDLRLAMDQDSPGSAPEPLSRRVERSISLDTPLQILFTSGTAGDPKGVVHTHRNLLASLTPIEREIAKYRRYERWVHPLRILHTLPLSHVFGQFMGLWVAPVLGATVHYESRMEPARLLGTLRRERITVVAAVPRVLSLLRGELLARHPGLGAQLAALSGRRLAARWWQLRHVHRELGYRFWAAVCGGATLPAELEEFWTTLGVALIQGYGMTETSALITLNHPFKPAGGTLGAPLPGRELQMTEDGELLVRGEMVATGRWQEGRLQVTTGDGWLRTGDLAARDEQGRLRYLGRTGERLVTAAGLNVYLQEVEAALRAQPGVLDGAALAMEGPHGAVPTAVLVASGAESAAAAVVAANATLQPHQRIARWWVWPELDLPRTATGKVRRRVLEAWMADRLQDESRAGGSGDRTQIEVAADPLLALIARATGSMPPTGPGPAQEQQPLEAFGLDSLARVQLQTAIEAASGRVVSDAALTGARTLGELRAAIGLPADTAQIPMGEIAAAGAPGPGLLPESREPLQGRAAPPTKSAVQAAAPRFLYPQWPFSAPVRLVRAVFLACILRPLVSLLARPRVVWHGAAVPQALAGAPMLIVSNHVTAYDVPLLLYALPAPLRRQIVVAAAGEMLENWRHARGAGLLRFTGPTIYFLLTALFYAFPLPRSRGFREAFTYAGRAMDRGFSVLVFPEGTRSHGGPIRPFQAGIGLLAQQAAVRVLPMALEQSRQRRRRPFAATVHIGEPVWLSQLPLAGEETPQAIALWLEQQVRQMLAAPAQLG